MIMQAGLFQPGIQFVDPQFYNSMVTLHGLIRCFFTWNISATNRHFDCKEKSLYPNELIGHNTRFLSAGEMTV